VYKDGLVVKERDKTTFSILLVSLLMLSINSFFLFSFDKRLGDSDMRREGGGPRRNEWEDAISHPL
jgi:hypothetical protein